MIDGICSVCQETNLNFNEVCNEGILWFFNMMTYIKKKLDMKAEAMKKAMRR